MAQQTAVEWLYNTMFEKKGRISKEEFEQAKEMEKEQREDEYKRGWKDATSESYKYHDRRSIN
jgi:hypothetical protein